LKTADDIDIDFFRGQRNPALVNPSVEKKGIRITRAIVIQNSLLCDELDEITTLMLRDKNI